jgi:adenylate cyclase class 2
VTSADTAVAAAARAAHPVPGAPARGRVHRSPRRNVELKARDPDPARSLAAALAIGATDHGELRQRDTYFHVANGGLKLREQEPGEAHLIQWERAEQARERESRYRIAVVHDPVALADALGAALGVRGAVQKRRRLLLWRDVRIHLDAVEGLGTFIELEAVAPAASDLTHEHALIAELRTRLSITDERLVPLGYAVLLQL